MKRRPRFLSSLVATALLSAACSDAPTVPTSSPPSLASEPSSQAARTTECSAILPPGTYNDIEVPEGETCTINGSVILGSITARQDSRLRMQLDHVGGRIVAEKPREVAIFSSTIGGDVRITDATTTGFGLVLLNGLTLHNGNIEIARISGSVGVGENLLSKGSIKVKEVFVHPEHGMNVLRNTVDNGGIRIIRNRGPGTKTVNFNTVAKTIACFENEQPFLGGPNIARRTRGQCL